MLLVVMLWLVMGLVTLGAAFLVWKNQPTQPGVVDAVDGPDGAVPAAQAGQGVQPRQKSSHTGPLIQVLGAGPYVVRLTARTSAGSGQAGAQAWKAPAAAREGCVMSFMIKFDPGFDFGCQGKVAGVAIGPGKSSGCRHTNDGASHRLMWRPVNGGQSYVYVPPSTYAQQPPPLNTSGKHKCGLGVFVPEFQRAFRTGVWHRVEIITKLNAPGKRDGVLALSIDGKMAKVTGVTWRTSASMQITSLSFGLFWGGGCVGKDSSLTYKDVAVHQFKD